MTDMKRAILSSLGIALLILAAPAVAQESTPETTPEAPDSSSAADQAELLLAKIKTADEELAKVTSELSVAEGEDLTILRTKFDELTAQQHADLAALVDLIQDREKAGKDFTWIGDQAEQLSRRSSRRLRSHLQALESELRQEDLERGTLAVDEVQGFEHRMAVETDRLNHLYLALMKLHDEMIAFGLTADAEQDFLERRLAQRGENLFDLLELTGKQLGEVQGLAKRAPDDHDIQTRLFATEERFDSNKTSLLATIHMLKALGMDYTDLEVRTLELTGEITPEALEIEVAAGLAVRWLQRAKSYLVENGPILLLRLLMIVGILLAFWVLARLIRRMVGKALDRSKVSRSKLLNEMLVSMTGRIVMAIGLIIVLSQLGINLGPLLAGLGIAGFIVGFALQDSLANFAAGAMILAYQPFDVGDLIEAAGVTGKVRDMNLVSTRILTLDHQTLIVPNSKIWGDVIRNVTYQPTRRVDMVFGISYEDDIPQAEQVLHEIVTAHDKVLDDPEPMVKVHKLGESSVDFIVRPWSRTEDYWNVYWDVTREVKMRFDREGISIPFPQRDVHLKGQKGANS